MPFTKKVTWEIFDILKYEVYIESLARFRESQYCLFVCFCICDISEMGIEYEIHNDSTDRK